jgi:hypothetical protein
MMCIARGEEADAILATGGKHWMGEGDLAVVEYDHCNVLEWHEGGLLLLNGKPELLAPQLGWA